MNELDDKAYRDFKIGDEVRIIGSDPIYDDCDVGWVVQNASEKARTMYVMRNDGSAGEEIKAEWYKTGRHNNALAEAIKALPYGTEMTREEVIEILKDLWRTKHSMYLEADIRKALEMAIQALEQEPKTGYWEWLTEDKYRCSNCNYETRVDECMNKPMYDFCPFCGAKMAERSE